MTVFNFNDYSCKHILTLHFREIRSLQYDEVKLVAGSCDKLSVWDGKKLCDLLTGLDEISILIVILGFFFFIKITLY